MNPFLLKRTLGFSGTFLLIGISSAVSVAAETPGNAPETAETLALGTGNRAALSSIDAVMKNPAGVASDQTYQIGSMLGYESSRDRWTVTAAAADGSPESLAAGISLRTLFGQNAYTNIDGRLAAAARFSDSIFVGTAARYIRLGDAETNGDTTTLHTFTMDASLQIALGQSFGLAALVYNLVPTDSSLAPLQAGGSLSLNLPGTLQAGFDFLVDIDSFDRTTYLTGGGAEYVIQSMVPVRLGYRVDTGRNLHAVTFGAGWENEKMAVAFGLRQNVSGNNETELLLSYTYSVPADPSGNNPPLLTQ